MKRYIPLLMAAVSSVAHADYLATLTTPSYVIEIQVHCEEGVVVCDDVAYRGVSRKTGMRINLHGKTLHSWCADGVTPCQFIGYEFRNKDVYYQVEDEGHLIVMRGKQILVDEKGDWK